MGFTGFYWVLLGLNILSQERRKKKKTRYNVCERTLEIIERPQATTTTTTATTIRTSVVVVVVVDMMIRWRTGHAHFTTSVDQGGAKAAESERLFSFFLLHQRRH